KFVRSAVLAHPELYFATLVLLGEGDSESIVLPRVLEAHGIELDPLRISVVPLGGRFVHHFWRLLDSLDIKYITLLDLDWGRHGGGWGRVKYAFQQLITSGVRRDELCRDLPDENGDVSNNHSIKNLHQRTRRQGMT